MRPLVQEMTSEAWRFVKDPSFQKNARTAQAQADNAWCWEIPCRRGGKFNFALPSGKTFKRKAHISAHGVGTLAYSGSGIGVLRDLLKVDGVRKHQIGDQEFAVTFPVSIFEAVAAVVKPYRKRKGPLVGASGG